ncbi:glycosyltransferase [Leucobacter komagatae]|uniref:D-inositol 3-phosphate glycosyltransferase n=1 Tax=Leucobacter komagatae TaxID=55969 RepID=A0A0D0H2L6_9MICO|nr:glycosyltransferase [Leucobacter komagatae]KIP51375.1 hypothetical protein SD72_15730 [Leucobacter komagatae]
MRVAIATRIFDPEPSAASFRLSALARSFFARGDEVRVLTVRPPRGATAAPAPYRVTRFPVIRDRTGYVRGYVQYMSFDIPLFFRVLCGMRQDAIVVEPPPTTALSVTVAARLRRTAVFPYAADVWSDASESTGAPRPVVAAVRWMERYSWSRAAGVLAVNDGVAARIMEIAPQAKVTVVGNGIDTDLFMPEGETAAEAPNTPYAIYTGTASEWQGAEVFVRAVAQLRDNGSALRLVFLGQGTSFPELQRLAEALDAPVDFHPPVPPAEAAAWLRGAAVSVASIRPGAGYDFAYPTKVFAAWACGTPVVYAGPGPAGVVLAGNPALGEGVDFSPAAVAGALERAVSDPGLDRKVIAEWAHENVSLGGVAARVTACVSASLPRSSPR